MSDEMTKHSTIRLARGYEFVAEFPDLPNAPMMLSDEPAPLGDGRGPNAADVLAAAVGNCLILDVAQVENTDLIVDWGGQPKPCRLVASRIDDEPRCEASELSGLNT